MKKRDTFVQIDTYADEKHLKTSMLSVHNTLSANIMCLYLERYNDSSAKFSDFQMAILKMFLATLFNNL